MDDPAQAPPHRLRRALAALTQAQRRLQTALDRLDVALERTDAAHRRRVAAAAGTRQLGGTWRWN